MAPTPAQVIDVQWQISPGSHLVLGLSETIASEWPEASLPIANRERRCNADRLETPAQAPCPPVGRVGPFTGSGVRSAVTDSLDGIADAQLRT